MNGYGDTYYSVLHSKTGARQRSGVERKTQSRVTIIELVGWAFAVLIYLGSGEPEAVEPSPDRRCGFIGSCQEIDCQRSPHDTLRTPISFAGPEG